jgi:hypothetical protein
VHDGRQLLRQDPTLHQRSLRDSATSLSGVRDVRAAERNGAAAERRADVTDLRLGPHGVVWRSDDEANMTCGDPDIDLSLFSRVATRDGPGRCASHLQFERGHREHKFAMKIGHHRCHKNASLRVAPLRRVGA